MYKKWVLNITIRCLLLLAIPQPHVWCALGNIEEAPVESDYWRQVHHFKDGSTYETHKIRKTIIKPEGIAVVSQTGFAYGKSGKVRVVSAVVTQPNGKRIILKKKQMDKRLVAGSAQGFTQNKQLSFLFPELTVGSTIEVVYEHHDSGKWLPGEIGIQLAFLMKNEKVNHIHEEHSTYRPWIFKTRAMEEFDVQLSKDKKTLIIRNKKPRYYHFVNELSTSYIRNLPLLVANTTDSLQASFDKVMPAWKKVLRAPLPKPMAKAVSRVADKPPEERVIELLRYIRDNYRYLGDWLDAKRGWFPFSLLDISKSGYGDCKDLSAILVAMLRASGIEADPVFVERSVEPAKILLPSVTRPNHAIVRAKVGEKIWWLDPTNPMFSPDQIPLDIHNRWAVIFGADNQAILTQIPRQDSHLTQIEQHQIFHYDAKGNAQIESRQTYSGGFASIFSAADYQLGAEALDRAICQGDTKRCTVKREKTDFLVPSSYHIQHNFYQKSALVGSNPYTIYFSHLVDLLDEVQHYLENDGQGDLYYQDKSRYFRAVLKNGRLTQSVKPHHITSPWFDFDLTWYDSAKDQGCVMELRGVRKVDWLDHKTLVSPEFKDFVDKLEAMTKDLVQTIEINEPKK